MLDIPIHTATEDCVLRFNLALGGELLGDESNAQPWTFNVTMKAGESLFVRLRGPRFRNGSATGEVSRPPS